MAPTHWVSRGDINAFFGLMLDNVAVMVILVSLISVRRRWTPQPEKSSSPDRLRADAMIPGTALGVLLGDLVFTWLAFRLARRTGRNDVTAMPLGLDTPSTFGVAFLVLLPALKDGYQAFRARSRTGDGVRLARRPGGAGVGRRLQDRRRRWATLCAAGAAAGLLGSLAAIALALIAFLPLAQDGIAGGAAGRHDGVGA